MGRFLAHVYNVGALATGLYGSAQGWAASLNQTINQASDGGLDKIVAQTPALVQPAVEYLPYGLALYGIMKVGERVISNRKITVQRNGAH